MLYPSIIDLLDITENRYTLVIAVSKRARQIIDEQREGLMPADDKPVNIATNEVYGGSTALSRHQSAEEEALES